MLLNAHNRPPTKRNQPQISTVLLWRSPQDSWRMRLRRGSELPQGTQHRGGRSKMTAGSPDSGLSGRGISISAKWSLLSPASHFISFKKNSNFRNIFVSIFILPYLSLCFLSG